jgi:hypothetical protein
MGGALPSDTLPGGAGYLASLYAGGSANASSRSIIYRSPAGEVRRLGLEGYGSRYAPSGHLLFFRYGALFAAPFDVETKEVTGQATQVLEGVWVDSIWGQP